MNSTTLPAAREAAIAARARHDSDCAALARGRERLAEAEAALRRLAADDEAAITRHAKRLEKQTREGSAGPVPALVPTDKHLAAQITAQRTYAAAVQMVTSLESSESGSAAALAAAEEALQAAVLTVLGEEADARAARLEALRREVEEEEQLLGAVRDLPGFRPSRAVYRALRDTLNLPINELSPTGSWDRAWNTPVNERDVCPVDVQRFWTERLAALLAGGEPSRTEAAA